MRALKIIANALLLFVVLPTTIVGVLGLVLSPFQPTARATQPSEMLEVNDLKLSDAVKEEVQRTEGDAPYHDAVRIAEVEEEVQRTEEDAPYRDAVRIAEMEEEVQRVDEGAPAFPEDETLSVVDESYLEPENAATGYYSSQELLTQGVIAEGGVNYTWYSQRVLPGGGLNIEGRHVSDEGYVLDGQGRIVVASSDLPYGTEIDVPFGNGTAVVLDTGCPSGVIDVYTNF